MKSIFYNASKCFIPFSLEVSTSEGFMPGVPICQTTENPYVHITLLSLSLPYYVLGMSDPLLKIILLLIVLILYRSTCV